MAVSVTDYDYALKIRYNDNVLKNMSYRNNPFYAKVRKKTDFDGKSFVFAVNYGAGLQARSAAFSTALSNTGATVGEDFTLTRKKNYAVSQIDSETVLSTRGKPAAFVSAMAQETDRKLYALIRSTAENMYLSGAGDIGSISSITSGVITLTNANDVTHFEKGQVLRAATSTAANVRSAKGYVISVDRDAGTVTVSATSGGSAGDPASWAAADELFSDGDFAAANDSNMISGLAAWLPATAPSSGDSFYGVDRSSDPTRLAGHRMTGTGKQIDEAIYDLAVRIGREGGRPDTCFMCYEKFGNLVSLLGNQVYYVNHSVGEIGFQALRMHGPAGPIDIFPDVNCPDGVAYVLQLDTWTLKTLGTAPMFLDLDGNRWLKISDSDGIEARMAVFGNLYTDAPGWNGRTTLA